MRALLEWHAATGTTALPRGDDAPAPTAPVPILIEPSVAKQHTEPELHKEERLRRLAVLADTVRTCQKCVLSETRINTAFARGNPTAEVCFVGEGPGADEDREGIPFVGKAGELLDKMIAAMGFARGDVYVCNIIKCRPPGNRNPEPAEVSACAGYLTEQLELVQPKIIVTLGNVPLKALFGMEGITKMRGTWRLYEGRIPTMPTYHPAYVLRNPTEKVRGDVWNDLKQVLVQLGRSLPKRNG